MVESENETIRINFEESKKNFNILIEIFRVQMEILLKIKFSHNQAEIRIHVYKFKIEKQNEKCIGIKTND